MIGSLERFRALIENSPDAISLVDTEGHVLYASASTAKVLGYQPQELLGQNGLDLLHPQDRYHSVLALKKVMADPEIPNRMQARVRQKDGQWRWVESTASNLLDEPDVGAIVLNYREIDTRRAEEEERQRLTEELIRSNNELQSFAHTVAHDLKEPLRTISMFTQLFVRKMQLDEGQKELAQIIVDGVRRMTAALDDLLASAACGFNDSLRPVDLEHAVTEAMKNLEEALSTSGAVITMAPLPAVQGNESELVRLFQNLISNALKYRTEADVEIHIAAEPVGPDWIVTVRDNGIGIAKEHPRSVFGLFKRLRPGDIPGAGIGLAVCKKIVEGLGGTIWVESELGHGSTFCFTLAAGSERPSVPHASGEV